MKSFSLRSLRIDLKKGILFLAFFSKYFVGDRSVFFYPFILWLL